MDSTQTPGAYVIRGAHIWRPNHCEFRRRDILIADGRIEEISDEINTFPEAGVIEAEGMYLMPGLVDMHVHFREPGYEYKETIASGTRAAARGGFTTVCTMPNLNPAPDSMENLDRQLEVIRRDAVIEVIPFATITRKRMGDELVDYASMASEVAGFSDDGSGVQCEQVMRDAMLGIAPTGKILAAHCEVDSLLEGGYVHKSPLLEARGHRGICSESEWKEVERDIRLAEETGCRLHLCHISTKESVELVRQAKARGVEVTCETGPHYLQFCDQDVEEDGRFKMNPPLRGADDRAALRGGVADGTIDVIATDHAPHSEAEKSKGLEKSAMGVVGLETSLAAVYTSMVESGEMPLERLVEVMAVAPRRILGLNDTLNPGSVANLVLVDFRRLSVVDPSDFCSMGRSTPFAGMQLKGVVVATIREGKIVYDNR